MRRPRATKPKAAEAAAPKPLTAGRQWSNQTKRTPEFDRALGTRIRSARLAAGISQTALGKALGISFQQVQKYELGKDRVASGTLQGIAAALGLHPGSFFDAETPAPSGTMVEIREAQRIGSRVLAIRNPKVIRRIMALVDTLASRDAGDQTPARDNFAVTD